MRTTVGVRELKNRLSWFLRYVQEGHDVIVTDRGHPVAVLQPVGENLQILSREQHLAALGARGLLKLGTGFEARLPRGKPGPSLSEAVLRDRSEGE